MNVAEPRSGVVRVLYRGHMAAFFVYLAAPLVAATIFAFNASLFPGFPWKGFTLDGFFGTSAPRLGLFHDRRLMDGLANSLFIGAIVAILSVLLGTTNAAVRTLPVPGKNLLYTLMIVRLAIPGVILGASISCSPA